MSTTQLSSPSSPRPPLFPVAFSVFSGAPTYSTQRSSALHADGRVGITEEELEEIVLAVQEDAAKARLPDTAARAVGVLTTEV